MLAIVIAAVYIMLAIYSVDNNDIQKGRRNFILCINQHAYTEIITSKLFPQCRVATSETMLCGSASFSHFMELLIAEVSA